MCLNSPADYNIHLIYSKHKDLHKTFKFLCFCAKIFRITAEIATVNVILFLSLAENKKAKHLPSNYWFAHNIIALAVCDAT